ncbi:PucR family transcriptional regulator [Nonomuraea rubra]|uniref:PucR family transcriptional regulator n=1 Tax=Nonomuraea rubra TaxID=46180 RepID=UPI0031E6A551
MPPSLQTVVRRMNLRPVAGTGRPGVLDAAVRWVAVSELADPTPYLEGGELLLTTGMRMEGDLTGYVARLVRRGVAGLGFGVGVSHEEVPPALASAAESAGLPLLEVPRETPFIAVGKAVSELLAAEQYEEISRAFAAQGRLTRAALRPEGMHAVIDRLAREVGGWAALLDESGEVRHATRGAGLGVVTAELARRRGQPVETAGGGAQVGAARAGGGERMPASLALSGPGEHVVVQPLGGGARPRGFFAVGAPHAFTPVTHTVINAAGSLLTLAMEQGRTQLAAERRLRTAVLELLLAGEGERARAVLGALGGRLPEPPLVVLAAGAEALEALEARAFAALLSTGPGVADAGSGGLANPAGSGGLAGHTGATDPRTVIAIVAESVAEEVALGAEAPVGCSQPCDAAGLRNALDQAGRALEAARGRDGAGGRRPCRQVRRAGRAGPARAARPRRRPGVLRRRPGPADRVRLPGRPRRVAARVPGQQRPLGRGGTAAGACTATTLRYRMRRVAELLGRDLDEPGTRAELWLALEAARRGATPASPRGSSR